MQRKLRNLIGAPLMQWITGSLSRKFTIGTAAGLIAVSVVFLAIFSRMYVNQLEQERGRAAEYVNRIFQTSLETAMLRRDLDGLRSIVAQLGTQNGIDGVMIINPAGSVRFADSPEKLGRQPRLDCTDCASLLAAGSPFTFFTPGDSGADILRSVNPVHNKPACTTCHGAVEDNPVNGILLVDYDATQIEANARNTTLMLMGSGAVVVLVTLIGGWWFMQRFVLRPIGMLVETSNALAQGRLDSRTTVSGSDELGTLGTTINAMADNLQRSLRAIREHERFLQDIVDAVPDGIRIIDDRFNIVLANTAYKAQLGLEADAAVHTTCHASAHHSPEPCAPTMITCPMHELRNRPGTLKTIHRHTHSDGHQLDVEIYAAPLTTVDADGTRRTLVVESIRNLEETVQFSHEQKLAELGRLAAGVAHEIRNPLASIRLALDTVLRSTTAGPERDDTAHEYLKLVDSEIDRCIDVTERLLKLSMFAGEHAQPVDINTAIRETLSLLAWEASSAGIATEQSLDAGAPRILASESDLRIVILNLAQNAVHAMPDGGHLRVCSRRHDGMVEIEIADDGVGIDAEDRKHIFDPFFSRRADHIKGTGLGLSITRAIVERYGGTIRVESELGQGARFVIRFPDIDKAEAEDEQ
jgi:PAS domain S-box-containing protein